MRKCCRMFTWPDWGKTVMKVYCGAATNIPVLYLFSSLDFVSVCKAANCCHGSRLALVCLAVVSVISAKIEKVKRAASSFIFALCDVLGTPSVPPFCHNNVWLWACVTSVCQGYKPAIPRSCFLDFHDCFLLWEPDWKQKNMDWEAWNYWPPKL